MKTALLLILACAALTGCTKPAAMSVCRAMRTKPIRPASGPSRRRNLMNVAIVRSSDSKALRRLPLAVAAFELLRNSRPFDQNQCQVMQEGKCFKSACSEIGGSQCLILPTPTCRRPSGNPCPGTHRTFTVKRSITHLPPMSAIRVRKRHRAGSPGRR